MNRKHRKILEAIFRKPTSAGIAFADIESLVRALGGQASEGAGLRVRFYLNGRVLNAHRPHSGKEAKKCLVEQVLEYLTNAGVTP